MLLNVDLLTSLVSSLREPEEAFGPCALPLSSLIPQNSFHTDKRDTSKAAPRDEYINNCSSEGSKWTAAPPAVSET